MTISLVTDSTADVPVEIVERYNIRVVPSIIVFGQDSFRDGVDLSREEFYRQLPGYEHLPTTAAPAAGEFEAVYRSLPPGPIISIHTAASLSGIYNAARLGAETFGDRITIIDSGSLSMGVGFQVMAAAEAVARGASLEEILAEIASVKKRLTAYALLDTLTNLRRGGRISLIRASVATILQIKPLIELTSGNPVQVATERTRSRAVADLVRRVRAFGRLEKLALIYTNNIEATDAVREQLTNLCANAPLIVQAAPTIGTHLGPNAAGVVVVKYE